MAIRILDVSANLPSRFWQLLAHEHQRQLEQFGMEAFKRHQAVKYFTWHWKWSALRQSEKFREQLRFLLRRTSASTWLRAILMRPGDLSDELWKGTALKRRDRWLFSFVTRLLWDFAEQHDPLHVCELPEPILGAPFPVNWRGRLISQDIANTALEMCAVKRALGDYEPQHVLEVGAGEDVPVAVEI